MINNRLVTAIIAAAGSSSRMRSSLSKQLMPLCGVPVLARTVSAFALSRYTDEIVIVCPRDSMDAFSAAVAEHVSTALPVRYVCGGASRQKSVWNGVCAADPRCDYILIHDGARPLITPALIDSAAEAVTAYSAVTLAVPVKDTIKVVSPDGTVTATPSRDTLRAVQTPQAFEKELYLSAYEKAQARGAEYTDDCALVESAGACVRVIDGDLLNIKVTTPEDIAMAESLYSHRSSTPTFHTA